MSFDFGNKIFQTIIAENSRYAHPQTVLDKSLSIAEIDFPLSNEECDAFAKRCVGAIKKKADLIKKLLPHGVDSNLNKCRDIAANMCFFETFHDFKNYADNFASMGATNRYTSGNTLKLVTSLWKVPENAHDPFIMQHIAAASAVLKLCSKLSLSEDVSILIATKFFQDERIAKSENCVTEDQVSTIVNNLHENPGLHYLNVILGLEPFKGKRKQAIHEFSMASYDEFISCQMLYPVDMGLLTEIPVSLSAAEVLTMAIMSDIHLNGSIDGVTHKQLVKKLASSHSRTSVGLFIEKTYKGKLNEIAKSAI